MDTPQRDVYVQIDHYNATYWLTTARRCELGAVMGESGTLLEFFRRRALVGCVRAGIFKKPETIDTEEEEEEGKRNTYSPQ